MTIPPIRYTRHARNRLRLHRLTREYVEAVLAQPAALTPDEDGKENAWGESTPYLAQKGYRAMTVTFIVEGERTVIITVTPRRRGPERE